MLITAYMNRLRLAGYRPSTITARELCLRAYERSLADHQATVADATRLHVEAFLARDLAPESRRAYAGHLHGLYRWAVEEGHLSSDPTDRLPSVRIPRAVPRPIDPDDLRKAVDTAAPQMRAWLLLMAMQGLRCIEVAALRPQDVTVTGAGGVLFLRECKGGGTASMPAHESIIAALELLPQRDSLWWECSRQHVSREVAVYLRSLGIDATGHRLRHYAGTSWLRASG
ncbi:tyrosine-type recombinase/integrase, partial [Nocardioides sp.]|uniref:tyrosine-type recombinase/integrase n=1 Tax=Nocardioides sp. TaxID=35761 RepID=UPI002BA95BA6|nr:hypothetical protein [Nocardioides sp.]